MPTDLFEQDLEDAMRASIKEQEEKEMAGMSGYSYPVGEVAAEREPRLLEAIHKHVASLVSDANHAVERLTMINDRIFGPAPRDVKELKPEPGGLNDASIHSVSGKHMTLENILSRLHAEISKLERL